MRMKKRRACKLLKREGDFGERLNNIMDGTYKAVSKPSLGITYPSSSCARSRPHTPCIVSGRPISLLDPVPDAFSVAYPVRVYFLTVSKCRDPSTVTPPSPCFMVKPPI